MNKLNHDLAGGDPFAVLKEEIRKKNGTDYPPFFDGAMPNLSKPDNESESILPTILAISSAVIIFVLSVTVAHFREEIKSQERTINILKADIERLTHSSHNPFVHARK